MHLIYKMTKIAAFSKNIILVFMYPRNGDFDPNQFMHYLGIRNR